MKNRRGYGKALISIIVSIISMMLIGLMKKTMSTIPFLNNILQFKNVGLESIKDFLEIHELNLRVDTGDVNSESISVDRKAKVIYSGVKIIWDGDGSKYYTLIVSDMNISKLTMMYDSTIDELNLEDMEVIKNKRRWIGKITIRPRSKLDTTVPCYLHLELNKFCCRLKTEQGRVSNELCYPNKPVIKVSDDEIHAWLSHERGQNYVTITEPDTLPSGSIKDYRIVLYIRDGRGIIKPLPKFTKTIKFKIGMVQPCLCYLVGTRGIGSKYEQYIGWIGEEQSMSMDETLSLDTVNIDGSNIFEFDQ